MTWTSGLWLVSRGESEPPEERLLAGLAVAGVSLGLLLLVLVVLET